MSSLEYKTKDFFSIWNSTQVGFFQEIMKSCAIDFFKAGEIFARLTDGLDRMPTYKEFKEEYNA